MARFARDCLESMTLMTRKLEVELGPDTADLGLRYVTTGEMLFVRRE
jgi:hypothetical protein